MIDGTCATGFLMVLYLKLAEMYVHCDEHTRGLLNYLWFEDLIFFIYSNMYGNSAYVVST